MNTSNDNLLELVLYITMSIALVILSLFFVGMVIVPVWKEHMALQKYNPIPIYDFIAVLGTMIILGIALLLVVLFFILKVAINLEKDKLKKEKLEKHENNIAIALVTFTIMYSIFSLIFTVLSPQKSEN